MKKTLNKHEGEIEVCAHRVTYSYWDFESPLTAELEERLAEEAESRAQHCLNNNCVSGELNHLYVNPDGKDEEIRGWWEIRKD